MNSFCIKAAVLSAVLSTAGIAPAIAQDKPVELRFAYWLASQHPVATLGFEPWAKSMEAASNGSIKVVFYPAQQLGKAADHYDMARDGIADLAWVSPGYQTGRFPVFEASELPFLIGSTGPGSAAIDAWYRKYVNAEMKDVKFCFAHNHLGALHSSRPISEPSQIKGLKVRSSNGMVAQLVNELGGTNVQVAAPEARDAVSKGIADALSFPWHTLVSFGIHKAVKYHMDVRFYSGNFVLVMNKAWYERLPNAQKKVVDDHCSNEWAARVGAAYGEFEDSGREVVEDSPDHTIIKLSAEQLDVWKQAVEPVVETWKKTAEKAGYKADDVLSDLRHELASRNALY